MYVGEEVRPVGMAGGQHDSGCDRDHSDRKVREFPPLAGGTLGVGEDGCVRRVVHGAPREVRLVDDSVLTMIMWWPGPSGLATCRLQVVPGDAGVAAC